MAGEPILNQFKADLGAQSTADAAQRAAATNRALISFGEVPDFNQNELGALGNIPLDIDPLTGQLAQQSTQEGLSTVAQLNKSNQDTLRNIVNQLGARGIFHSGETGYQVGEQALAFKQNQFSARQQLIDYLSGFQQGFAQREAERQRLLSEATANAQARLQSLPQNQVIPERNIQAGFDPRTGLYYDRTGQAYNAQGEPVATPLYNPFNPEPPPPPPIQTPDFAAIMQSILGGGTRPSQPSAPGGGTVTAPWKPQPPVEVPKAPAPAPAPAPQAPAAPAGWSPWYSGATLGRASDGVWYVRRADGGFRPATKEEMASTYRQVIATNTPAFYGGPIAALGN